jgi:hypothetical protein
MHIVELYQQSLKSKGKVVEINLVYEDDKNHNLVAISKVDDPVLKTILTQLIWMLMIFL